MLIIIVVTIQYVLHGWLESKTLFCSCGLTLRCDFIELTVVKFVFFLFKSVLILLQFLISMSSIYTLLRHFDWSIGQHCQMSHNMLPRQATRDTTKQLDFKFFAGIIKRPFYARFITEIPLLKPNFCPKPVDYQFQFPTQNLQKKTTVRV